jgi:DNA (cytosine-5)-methyltransferase 1
MSQGERVRALDLFSGAGLSAAGATAGGARILAAVDMCPIATATYAANFPRAKVLNSRLENVSPARLHRKIGDLDLIIASPDCTNHTCAKGGRPRSERSRATALQAVRFAREFEPRWIVMENVVHMRPWPRYGAMIASLQRLGYHIREQVLDASLYGVPQKRRRLFIIGDREKVPGQVAPPPAAQCVSARQILDGMTKWKTTPLSKKGRAQDTLDRAKRAIAGLGRGESFLIVYYGSDGSGGWQSLDRPLRTVTTVDRFALIEPTHVGYHMRMLQVSELRRAMGLGSEFVLPVGTRREQIKLLGNGVCPPVMQRVVESLTA